MAQTIKLKRSAVAGRIPSTSDLELGEVAINTYDGKMYIKKTVNGVDSIVEIGANGFSGTAFTQYTYTATANQSVFTGADNSGSTLDVVDEFSNVFMNGVLLDPDVDFTVSSDGLTLTLTTPAAAGDIIQINSFDQAVFNGTLDVDQLIASGITYPTTDGTNRQVIMTDGSGTLSFENLDTIHTACVNQTGSTLLKGTPVYQTGTSGNTMIVAPADASSASTMPAVGVLEQDLADQAEGFIIHLGQISGVDTSAFSEGDTIYVAVGGGFTNVPPTGEGNLLQNLGQVTKVHATNGGGVVMGAGRSNATPNLNDGNIFIGNASNQAVTNSFYNVLEATTGYNNSNWDTAYGWGDHSTQNYATETYVSTAISNLVDSAPATLDTLNELAAALGDDPNFATTVTNSIAGKASKSGDTFTGRVGLNYTQALKIGESSEGMIYAPSESSVRNERYFLRFNYTDNDSFPYLCNRTPNGRVGLYSGGTSGGVDVERIRILGGDGTKQVQFHNSEIAIGSTTVLDSSRSLININGLTSSEVLNVNRSGNGNAITTKTGSIINFQVENYTTQTTIRSDTNTFYFWQPNSGYQMKLSNNGAVSLAYDGSWRLDTTSTGILATGHISRFSGQQNGESRLELYNNRQDLSNVPVYSLVGYNASESSKVTFYRGSGGSGAGYIRFATRSSNLASMQEVFQIGENSDAWGVNVLTGGYRVGGTTVIDSARNANFNTLKGKGIWDTSSAITHWGSADTSTAYGTLTWDTGYASIYGTSGNELRLGSHATQGRLTLTDNVNSTSIGGASFSSGSRLGFNESGVRSWTMGAASGYFNLYSGDGNGFLNLNDSIGLKLNGTTVIDSSKRFAIGGVSIDANAQLTIGSSASWRVRESGNDLYAFDPVSGLSTRTLHLKNTGSGAKLNIAMDGDFKIGTTTVIDSSRNLTNIGTASLSGAITAQGYIDGSTAVIDSSGSLGVKNSSNSTGKGLSLYGGATSGMPTYGIAFAGTGTFGTHGGVTSDWATYFTMNDNTTRGWIFKRGTTNVASIDGGGDANFNDITGRGKLYFNKNGQTGYHSVIDIHHIENNLWAMVFQSSTVGNDNESGFWIGNNGYPDMRLRRDDGTVRARISSWEGSFVSNGFNVNGGALAVGGTDVIDSSRNLTNIGTVNSGAVTNDNTGAVRILHPDGASYTSNSATGAIKITLPVAWTNTMMRMTVKVYEYTTGESFEVVVGGYNHTGSNGLWYNTFAHIISDPDTNRNFTVRYGHDGTKACIWIGETNSSWSYPKVSVVDFQAGHSNANESTWATGWAISFVTTLGTIQRTHTNNEVGIDGYEKRIGGTTVIDSSRNLTNIGTINNSGRLRVSGGNNADGNSQSSTGAVIGTYVDQYAFIDLASSHADGSWIDFGYADGADYKGRIRYTNSGNYFRFYANGAERFHIGNNVNVLTGDYLVNGTTVIDSSRNLTNISSYNGYTPTQSAGGGRNSVTSFDNRSTNDTPSSREKGFYVDFKQQSAIGLSASGLYAGVLTFRSYGSSTDLSGGYPIQIAYAQDGQLYSRYGASSTSWGNWTKICKEDTSGNLTVSGNVTAYSDITLKRNITEIDNALDKVNSIRGVTYDRIDQGNARHAGVIAQEVEEVLPEVVHTDDDGIKSVAYGNMVGLLIEAIKEQQAQIEEQNKQIQNLTNLVNTLMGKK